MERKMFREYEDLMRNRKEYKEFIDDIKLNLKRKSDENSRMTQNERIVKFVMRAKEEGLLTDDEIVLIMVTVMFLKM